MICKCLAALGCNQPRPAVPDCNMLGTETQFSSDKEEVALGCQTPDRESQELDSSQDCATLESQKSTIEDEETRSSLCVGDIGSNVNYLRPEEPFRDSCEKLIRNSQSPGQGAAASQSDAARKQDPISASPLKNSCTRAGRGPEKTLPRMESESRSKGASPPIKSPPSFLKNMIQTSLAITENQPFRRERFGSVEVSIKMHTEEGEAWISDSPDKLWYFRSKKLYQSVMELVLKTKNLPNLSLLELHRTRFKILGVSGLEELKIGSSEQPIYELVYSGLEIIKSHVDPETQDIRIFQRDYLADDSDLLLSLEAHQTQGNHAQKSSTIKHFPEQGLVSANGGVISSSQIIPEQTVPLSSVPGQQLGQATILMPTEVLPDPRKPVCPSEAESREGEDDISEKYSREDCEKTLFRSEEYQKRSPDIWSGLLRGIQTHFEEESLTEYLPQGSPRTIGDRFVAKARSENFREFSRRDANSELINRALPETGKPAPPTIHELNSLLHKRQKKHCANKLMNDAMGCSQSMLSSYGDYWSVKEVSFTGFYPEKLCQKQNPCPQTKNPKLHYSSSVYHPQQLNKHRKLFSYTSNTRTSLLSRYSFSRALSSSQPCPLPPIIREISDLSEFEIEIDGMRDDYYNNLLDWLPTGQIVLAPKDFDIFAVDLQKNTMHQIAHKSSSVITAIKSQDGDQRPGLGVGCEDGTVRVFDPARSVEVSKHQLSVKRIGCLAWKGPVVASGSRSADIFISDIRSPRNYEFKLRGHEEEVCGLSWCPNKEVLASGGNENTLNLWDIRRHNNYFSTSKHKAAVKAIDFSKTTPNLLLSGGGTKDHRINLWDSAKGTLLGSANTDSQICALITSPFSDEFVTSEGAHRIDRASQHSDPQRPHNLYVWKVTPDFQLHMVACILAHHSRVSYMALNPLNGEQIVTGSSDQRLRVFRIFSADTSPELGDVGTEFARDQECTQFPDLPFATLDRHHLRVGQSLL